MLASTTLIECTLQVAYWGAFAWICWHADSVWGWLGKIVKWAFGGARTGSPPNRDTEGLDTFMQEAQTYAQDWRLFTVACAAKFAKVDGVVTKNEIQVVERLFATLCLTGELRPLAIRTFQQAKNGKADLQECVCLYGQLYGAEEYRLADLFLAFLDVAHSDGEPSERTRQALVEVFQLVGLDAQECFDVYAQQQQQRRGQAKRTDVEAAYTVLGCQPTDTLGVIKTRYRKLVKDYHPDTLSGKNLAPDFLQFAEERFKQTFGRAPLVLFFPERKLVQNFTQLAAWYSRTFRTPVFNFWWNRNHLW